MTPPPRQLGCVGTAVHSALPQLEAPLQQGFVSQAAEGSPNQSSAPFEAHAAHSLHSAAASSPHIAAHSSHSAAASSPDSTAESPPEPAAAYSHRSAHPALHSLIPIWRRDVPPSSHPTKPCITSAACSIRSNFFWCSEPATALPRAQKRSSSIPSFPSISSRDKQVRNGWARLDPKPHRCPAAG